MHESLVQNQCVAGLQEPADLGHSRFLDLAARTVGDQQARRVPLFGRVLRDQFGGQMVVEIGDIQDSAPVKQIQCQSENRRDNRSARLAINISYSI